MNISKEMVRNYLAYVTVGWFDDHELPPSDVNEYRAEVDNMILVAKRKGDLADLQLGIAALLADPTIDLEAFIDTRYPYEADELKEIVRYVNAVMQEILPTPTTATSDVRLISQDLRQWWRERGR